jgi:hypothetical protein
MFIRQRSISRIPPLVIHNPRDATMPPDDQEFGYRFNVGNAWGTTLFSRKVEIAHARAIQKQAYGRNQWSGTQCSHCVKQGYSCRVCTDFILINSPQLLLGYACQHCRLWGKDCDVLRITGASRPISRQGTSLVEHQSKPARHGDHARACGSETNSRESYHEGRY